MSGPYRSGFPFEYYDPYAQPALPYKGARPMTDDLVERLRVSLSKIRTECAPAEIADHELISSADDEREEAADRIEADSARIAELEAEVEEARTILAHTDLGSLPNDWTLKAVAEARIDDLTKLRDQVRNTCRRAEKAEAEVASYRVGADRVSARSFAAERARAERAEAEKAQILRDMSDVDKQGGDAIILSARDCLHLRQAADEIERLTRERADMVEALRAMPCYGCSTMPGDDSADAVSRSRGCVTCRPARAALSRVTGAD